MRSLYALAFAVAPVHGLRVGVHATAARAALRGAPAPQLLLKERLVLDPEVAARVLEDGAAASQGPFGKGGALEWVATASDAVAAATLAGLHAWDDKAVQDSSKNLQVLWSRAVLHKNGQLDDPYAIQLLPESTRGAVAAGAFDGVLPFLEWVQARTEWLDQGCDVFLSSPSVAEQQPCQVVIFGAGFDTRSIRYQREGLRFIEVDLPETIEAKRTVHHRYRDNVDPSARLPTLVGFDLNDCEHTSLLAHLEEAAGLDRSLPTLFISEAVMFYVNPAAIASLYNEVFDFGQQAEAMYCFTDSMRPFVQGPFSDEIGTFLDAQCVELCSHTSRWSGAVQFMHAVARTPTAEAAAEATVEGDADAAVEGEPAPACAANNLLSHVQANVKAAMTSYAPERSRQDVGAEPSFINKWYALAYSSELPRDQAPPATPYHTRLFGEPLTLSRDSTGEVHCQSQVAEPPPAPQGEASAFAQPSHRSYVVADHQGLIWLWRGAAEAADHTMLPTHPTPEQTHTVETILDYGVDWKYIVENNLDTPHLYWLHDGSIPPIESLGCNRKNIGGIGLRFFTDDVGFGHIGKTSSKVTKVVRFDSPNVVRHGGVSGFSEEFNIIPIGPHRTRVLLRQRFPKGPILSALLSLPGTEPLMQYLVRNWNYQIGLEDYSVMQGQAHNIDDFGAPNWRAASTGDDLIVRFWQWKRKASLRDSAPDYFTRWDGSRVDEAEAARVPVDLPPPSAWSSVASTQLDHLRPHYSKLAPFASFPPVNNGAYRQQQTLDVLGSKLPELGFASIVGACSGFVAAAVAATNFAQAVDLLS